MSNINLFGRVIIKAEIHALSGLQIGGSGAGSEIGGLDKEVIRNPSPSALTFLVQACVVRCARR